MLIINALLNYFNTNGLLNYTTLFIGFLTLYLIYHQWRTSYWAKYGIKGPKPLPFIGLMHVFFSKTIWQADVDNVKKYGNLVARYVGIKPALLVADPDIIRCIFVKDFHIFPQGFQFPYVHPVERKFLTILWGEEWKRVRSLLSPTFTTGKLRKMFDILKGCTADCMRNLDSHVATNDAIDLKHFWGRYNMDVIAKVCFATNLNAYANEKNRTLESFERLFAGDLLGALIIINTPQWFVRLMKASFTPIKPLNYLEDLTRHVIESRKKDQNSTGYNDFLQILLESEINDEKDADKKQKLSTQEVISSAIIFLEAGYETTSTLLTWTCWELANNPDIQSRLYDEICSLDEFTHDSLQTLPYLNAVLEETLRKHPPVTLLQRVAHQDYQIPGTQAILPKGSSAIIPVYAIHHNPEYWPNPEVYNPERFMPENKESIKPYSFLPFGAGPRICIGMRFAMINAKLALSTVLKRFKFVKNDKTTTKLEYSFPGVNLTAKNLTVGIEHCG